MIRNESKVAPDWLLLETIAKRSQETSSHELNKIK